MKDRCLNPKSAIYKYYGGRGIRICEHWLKGFRNFYDDAGPCPSDHHSIDRIDTNGHYEPGNVRWATRQEQGRNTRGNRVLEFRGESKLLVEWAEEIGIDADTIGMRLKSGWSVEEALSRPLDVRRRNITYRGKTQGLMAWSRETGIHHGTLAHRLDAGYPLEDVFSVEAKLGGHALKSKRRRSP